MDDESSTDVNIVKCVTDIVIIFTNFF